MKVTFQGFVTISLYNGAPDCHSHTFISKLAIVFHAVDIGLEIASDHVFYSGHGGDLAGAGVDGGIDDVRLVAVQLRIVDVILHRVSLIGA